MARRSYVRPYLEEAVEDEREYDPREAVERSTTASWEAIADDVKQTLGDFRGRQVGMGRLNTGFATEDEDRIWRQAMRDQANITSQRALEGEQLYGQSRNRYLELLSGEDDRFVRDENLRRRKRGGIGGLIGGALGAVAGSFIPGVGTALGAGIGSRLGGGIGSHT